MKNKSQVYISLIFFVVLLCFALGWLKFPFAFVFFVSLTLLSYFSVKKSDLDIKLDKYIIYVFFVSAIFVFLSGIGGFWAQSKDYPWRNAIFRDLILRDWPVYYPKSNGYLVYYFGYWLVPALFGKLAYKMGATELWAFRIGNCALYIWSVILVSILFILLTNALKADTKKKQILIPVLFIFFSGMDILGSIEPLGANMYHLEWWADNWQYSSFTTCLFWVFNQSIIPWICMALLIQQKNVRNYVFIGMICLFCGPLPFVGLFIYCITYGIIYGIRSIKCKKLKSFIKDIFSPQNIIASLVVFPIIAIFLLSNDAISGTGSLRLNDNAFVLSDSGEVISEVAEINSTDGVESAAEMPSLFDSDIGKYFLFVLFEFGIYALLIARKYYKNPLYWVTIGSLLIFPFFKMGSQADFPMRASIPALFMLFVMIVRFLFEEKDCLKQKGSTNRMLYIILIVCLVLGAATPAVEIYRGCRQVALKGLDNPMEDYLYTLGSDGPYNHGEIMYLGNFGTNSPEDKFFFKYLCK